MLPAQRGLNGLLKYLERLRAGYKPVVDEESRGTRHPGRVTLFDLGLNLGGCLPRLQAGDESIGIEAQSGGVPLVQFGRVLLIAPLSYCLEEAVVHGPEGFGFLLGGAERGLGGEPRRGVDGIDGELKENVLDYASGYVRFIQKRVRL
jgi:hypothetical protein